jgi:hypothetical protein
MKTITLSAVLLVLTISLSSFVLSNKETKATTVSASKKGPGPLRVHRKGSAISLTWSNDAQAASFKIQRGDGEIFENLDEIPSNGARSYKYEDHTAFPGTNYYRIVCVDADGNELCTYTDVIKVTQRG